MNLSPYFLVGLVLASSSAYRRRYRPQERLMCRLRQVSFAVDAVREATIVGHNPHFHFELRLRIFGSGVFSISTGLTRWANLRYWGHAQAHT